MNSDIIDIICVGLSGVATVGALAVAYSFKAIPAGYTREQADIEKNRLGNNSLTHRLAIHEDLNRDYDKLIHPEYENEKTTWNEQTKPEQAYQVRERIVSQLADSIALEHRIELRDKLRLLDSRIRRAPWHDRPLYENEPSSVSIPLDELEWFASQKPSAKE